MKILILIFAAIFFKSEAEAQTWWNISPKNMDVIKKMQMIQATDGKTHLLVNSDTTVYSLIDGKKWKFVNSIKEGCIVPYDPPYEEIRFRISSIVPIENDSLLIVYDGFWCGSFHSSKTFFVKTTLDNFFDYKLDTLFKAGGNVGSKNLALYDSVNKKYYLTLTDWGKLYFTEFKESGYERINMQELKLSDSLKFYQPIGDLFVLDSRNGKIYITPYSDSIFIRNDTTWRYTFENLYKRSLHDTIWNLILKLPIKQSPPFYNYHGGFYDISFHSDDSNISYLATGQGLWRYNDSTNHIDTLLKASTRSIFFKEDSDIAYAGTEWGEIYRSTDAGETWSLLASGFSTKPVIGIYASGNDSLIVGTEDGIWANYALPVSVAEEQIPSKNNELTITPNPANTSVKISFLKTDVPQQLDIYNSLGQVVFKTEFSGDFVWDFNYDVPDGVYTIVVKTNSDIISGQFIILH